MDASLTDLDATALAELVRAKEVHPRELVDQAIDRIEQFDPQLNVMVHRQYERARNDADGLLPDGPFRGVPFLFKDYRCREAGEPYTMGMRALRDIDYRAASDAPLALAFRAAGLIPLGRANTPELASVGTCEPEAFGPTHNPWAPESHALVVRQVDRPPRSPRASSPPRTQTTSPDPFASLPRTAVSSA